MPNCWTCDNEQSGSLFHELIVLPTLALNVARPEYLPGAPAGPIILPQPKSQQIANGAFAMGSLPALGILLENLSSHFDAVQGESVSGGGNSAEDKTEDVCYFYVNVTVKRIQTIFTNCGPGKPKVVPEFKLEPKLAVFNFSYHQIVNSILEVHGLQEQYVPGPVSGPPFCLFYKAFSGRQKNALTIRSDDNWENVVNQLSAMRDVIDTIQVTVL